MATPQEELAELNRQIADLKRQLGDTSEFVPIQNLQDAQRLFVSMKREVDAIGEGLSFVAQSFRDSVAELSKQNTELNFTKSALKSISTVSQKILTTRSLDGEISEKELASLEKKALLQFKSLEIAVQSGRISGEALDEAKNALAVQEEFFKGISSIRKEQESINKAAGVKLFTGLEEIANAIPGFNKFTEVFKEASKASKEQAQYNKSAFDYVGNISIAQGRQNKAVNKGIDQYKKLRSEGVGASEALKQAGVNAKQVKVGKLPTMGPLTAGLKSLGPALTKALGPLAILKELFDAFKAVDQRTGNIAKQLGTSYKNASQLNSQFNSVANSSGNVMINSKGVSEAFMAISKDLGTSVALSEELLLSQTRLVEQAFYSVEAATQLTKLSLVLGENSEDITKEFLGQAEALNIQNGLAVNSKQLLEASLKISKATLLTLTSQKGELAKAAFEAKKLGLELTKLDSIAEGLLQIEQSISAEFEAEVISGRQLTLERARYFALTNDLAGVARELTNQGITQEYYANANRIEQVAIAQAMGMSRDEMGAMLIEQTALSKIGAKDNEAAKIKFEQLKAQHGLQYAIKNLGDEQYAQQLQSASVADRFNKTMEKLREVFVGLVDPLMPVLDVFVSIFSLVGKIIKLIDPLLKGVSLITKGLIAIFDLSGKSDAAVYEASDNLGQSLMDNWGTSKGLAFGSSGPYSERKVGDAMIPAVSGGGNAIYSPVENTLYKGTVNDVATLQPKNTIGNTNTRNQPSTVTLSAADVKAIADAVRDGAMQGTSKARVVAEIEPKTIDRMSNRIQPYLATNTYNNSI